MTSAAMTSPQAEAFCQPEAAPFSIVVDDVDARAAGDETQALHKLLDLRKCSQCGDTKEQSDAKIRQIKVEAESRKMEFAQLLEEHAQVIRKLKQMEEDGAALGVTHA